MQKTEVVGAELAGTFLLVFAGCGAIVVNDLYGGMLGHLGISLVFGLSVMTVIYSLGSVSGAHINPAVTIGLWAAGRLPAASVPYYLTAQIAGAVIAAMLLRLQFPEHATLGATLPSVDTGRALLMELTISFVLMLTILSVTMAAQSTQNLINGAVVGGVVAMLALFAGPVTGASMNPARSLGPALLSGEFTALWIYMLAPVAGALLATPCCRLLRKNCCPQQVCSGSAF